MKRIKVIDSHTGGEPTRIIYFGGPDLGEGTLAQRQEVFRDNFDDIRRAVVNEPRGSEVLVGGLICRASNDECTIGIIFFNNTGYLGMCGHGTIGLMVTLQHLDQIQTGKHLIETPVGIVEAELAANGLVTIQNVPSYRYLADVVVETKEFGSVIGDVAWGGNWFFLTKEIKEAGTQKLAKNLVAKNSSFLTTLTLQIRDALKRHNVTGAQGAMIDHVELLGDPVDPRNNSRNFVLCPGGAYDRSPCGTGLSAKLACLAADGALQPGETWRQESVIGSVFSGSFTRLPAAQKLESDEPIDAIVPMFSGTAYVSGESNLLLDPGDPFCMGIQ